jgi:hypothetical protein
MSAAPVVIAGAELAEGRKLAAEYDRRYRAYLSASDAQMPNAEKAFNTAANQLAFWSQRRLMADVVQTPIAAQQQRVA